MRSITSILTTKNTHVNELQDLIVATNKTGNVNALHAKKRADGSLKLYASKGAGTGFKRFFFPREAAKRESNARIAILQIMEHTQSTHGRLVHGLISNNIEISDPRKLDQGIARTSPLSAKTFEKILPTVVDAEVDFYAQPMAKEIFRKIGLDLEGYGPVFSYTGELKDTLFAAQNTAHALSRIRKKFEYETKIELDGHAADFIRAHPQLLNRCPFDGAGRAFTSIIATARFVEQDANNSINNFFKKGLIGSEQEVEKSSRDLSECMQQLLKELKFGQELLTNEDFINTLPAKIRKPARELGKSIEPLHKALESQFKPIAQLAGFAINSPKSFSSSLRQYQAEMPNGTEEESDSSQQINE